MTPASAPSDLPEILPVLPLAGVVLMPREILPLNIFETRYLALIEEAMKQGRILGLIQPKAGKEETPPLYQVGSAGRIVSFAETADGRFLVNLIGVSRFALEEELPPSEKGFRRARVSWTLFAGDREPAAPFAFDRPRLMTTLKPYFRIHGIAAEWEIVENTPPERLIASLSMVCPLPPNEKQALLETATPQARGELLISLLEMAVLGHEDGGGARH